MAYDAFSYDHTFADIGKLVEAIDDVKGIADSTLVTMEDDVADVLINEADLGDGETPYPARYDILSGVPEMFRSFRNTLISWINSLGGKVDRRLLDLDHVLEWWNLTEDTTIIDLLKEMYRRMVDDSETLDRSTVTLTPSGVLGAFSGNGTGLVFNTELLDGYTDPGSDFPSIIDYAQDLGNAAGAGRMPGEHADYTGTLTELCVVSETMTLECVSDSETSGSPEGAESFQWDGGPQGSSPFDWEVEGSGSGPIVQVANGAGLVADGEFESFTSDDPDNWDVDDGTAGTHILENTAAEYRGDACLEFAGSAAEDPLQISQTIAGLTPLKRYFVGCWVKGEAGIADGVLTIQFEGTGYIAGTTEKISMNAAALAAQTSFGEEGFFFTVPAEVPSNFELVVKIVGILTNTKSVLIDGLVLAPVNYHGGCGVVILAGDEPFLLGDRVTFTVANDDAGTFQRFFRRRYGIQLPSAAGAGETIADSLAE